MNREIIMKKNHPLTPLSRLLVFIFLVTNVFFWYKPAQASLDSRVASLPMRPLSLSGLPTLGPSHIKTTTKIEKTHAPAGGGKNSPKMVYLLKDVHLNPEAQRNMAHWIEGLLEAQEIDLIGVEGTYGSFDFSRYRELPDPKIKKSVADSYLEGRKIGAPSYVGLTSRSEVQMVGLEDPELYESNVQAYLRASAQFEELTAFVQKSREDLALQKAKIFNRELWAWDQTKAHYHQRKIKMGEYIQDLNRRSSKVEFYPQIEQFLASYEIERKMDFAQVEHQRRRLMEVLLPKISSEDTENLMDLGLKTRLGEVTFAEYYRTLKNVAEGGKLNLKRFPNLDEYIRYVLLADALRVEPLLKEIRELESAVATQLMESLPKEKKTHVKQLFEETRQIELTEKLSRFELTPQERVL